MKNTVDSVVNSNICISCGICQAVCPTKAIQLEKKNGLYQPFIQEELCTGCGICLKVCGGRGMNQDAYENKDKNEAPKNCYFGNSRGVFSAMAKNSEILKEATSGGVISALVYELLQKKEYDAAFLVNTDNFEKRVETVYTENGFSLKETQKSRYIPVTQTKAVEYILANRDKKVILIGVSCFIQGINKVIEQFHLERENYLLLGLFCDKNMNYNIYDYFKRHPQCEHELAGVLFRTKAAGGWPGKMRFLYQDGSCTDIDSSERIKVKDYFQMEGCLYCLDKLNQFADISVGDNYTGENSSKQGSSSVIIRSRTGERIWNMCSDLFQIWPSAPEQIMSSQSLEQRKENYKYRLLKKSKVLITPDCFGESSILTGDIKIYQNKLKNMKMGAESDWSSIKKNLKKRQSVIRSCLLNLKYKLHSIKENIFGKG